jgi:hypothetical protein
VTDDANKFVDSAKDQWGALVRLAILTPANNRKQTAYTLASASKVGKTNLENKLKAIHLALAAGVTVSELIERGQRWTIEKYVIDKKNGRQDAQVSLRWMVAPELRDTAHEATKRLMDILHMRTSDELWMYLVSQMVSWTVDEILHSAGEGDRIAKNRSTP